MEWLALILLVGLAGPLLALPRRFALPVALGELLAGVVIGRSGFDLLPLEQPEFELLKQVGFAVVMMLVASHIDVRAVLASKIALPALGNVFLVTVFGLLVGWFAYAITGVGSVALFAVLLSSSSAAVVLPALGDKEALRKHSVLVAQVTFADLLAIIALPVVQSGTQGLSTIFGAALLGILAFALFGLLHWADSSGRWKKLRKVSRNRHLGIELRLSLILLLSLSSLAQNLTVSVMLAGVGVGLAIAANGVPRRLARQMFAVSEGFFAPLFFVLLGATLDFRAAFSSPSLILLAVILGFGAVAVHLASTLSRMPVKYALVSASQMGVPAAAVSLGQASGQLSGAQGAAIMLAAVITLLVTAVAVSGIPQRELKGARS